MSTGKTIAEKKEVKKEAKKEANKNVVNKDAEKKSAVNVKKPTVFKISKIGVSPKRKYNLGNYHSVELSAFVEVVFEKPIDSTSPEVLEAFQQIRTIARNEMKTQFDPYVKKSVIKEIKKDADSK